VGQRKAKKVIASTYLGVTAIAAKNKLLSFKWLDKETLDTLLKKFPRDLEAEELINKQIRYLKLQIGEYPNINAILSKTIADLQTLKKLHSTNFRETSDCWDCRHNPDHSSRCLKYNEVYTGHNDGNGLCPSYQTSETK